jgi:hypothetical protein
VKHRNRGAEQSNKGAVKMALGRAVTIVILTLWSSASLAQDRTRESRDAAPGNMGTTQEQAACRKDVRKFCQDLPDTAGPLSFLSCLQANRSKISKACQNVLASHGQ